MSQPYSIVGKMGEFTGDDGVTHACRVTGLAPETDGLIYIDYCTLDGHRVKGAVIGIEEFRPDE